MYQAEHLQKSKNSMGYLLFLMILISPMLVLQVRGKELFLWLQILFVLGMVIKYRRIRIIQSPFLIMIFVEPFIAALFAFNSTMPEIYKKAAINLSIMAIPLFFTACYINKLIKDGHRVIDIIIKAIKTAVIIELVWIFFQFSFYKFLDIDINEVIFVNILHTVENASFIRSWVWYPSGLSWHSAVLAPLFVMGILFFENTYIRLLILLEAFLCGNSTTLLGVVLCCVLLCLRALYQCRVKILRKKTLELILAALLLLVVLFATDIKDKLADVIIKLWQRLFGAEKDASTAAHFGYYSDYLKIVQKSSLSQILFGYGVGCSGYTITALYGRYADGGTWAIECDYINILVSRGIIGFVSYYGFLFFIMIKGIKIDFRYFVFIFVILFQGFGYNVQFDYLLLIEIVLYLSIRNNINFFSIVDRNHTRILKRGSGICLKYR